MRAFVRFYLQPLTHMYNAAPFDNKCLYAYFFVLFDAAVSINKAKGKVIQVTVYGSHSKVRAPLHVYFDSADATYTRV